ncbi:MAG: DNA recombination protein RmuC [Candidatus Gastranaerophilales bacterium]|nr:DNA recombination protein RmuC [Candidatus Gastranaerophilales bacterium]
MITSQLILTGFLGFTLGILAILQIKAVKDTLKDAKNLTKALTTNQNLKGQFGEDCLEAILKSCFPEKNINYLKQFITKNEDNKEIKPDYLVNLPNNKSILIDCKLNLDKYLNYVKKPDIARRNEFIKDINTTINNLANKKYQTSKDIAQPNFILMYIPLEPVITLIYTDKDFINIVKNANDKNIIIVGNSGILTAIRLVKILWAQDVQNNNVENIVNLSQNLYDLIAQHSNALYEAKKVLDENMRKFNKEYEKLTSSKIFNAIEQLKNYGIEASNHKIGKKNQELEIHSDFLNN